MNNIVPVLADDFKELIPFLMDHYKVAGMDERINYFDLEWSQDKFIFDYFCDPSVHIYSIKRLNKIDCIGAFNIVKSKYGRNLEAIERLCFASMDLSLRKRVQLCSEMIDYMQEEAKKHGATVFRMGVWPGNAMGKLMKKKGFTPTDLIYSRRLSNG